MKKRVIFLILTALALVLLLFAIIAFFRKQGGDGDAPPSGKRPLSSAEQTLACDAISFEQYPATETNTGPVHGPDFSTKPEAEMFRSAIRDAMSKGVNFAGAYVVASWGCGTSCQSSAIIDARTGAIAQYGIGSEYGLAFRKDSALIVKNPFENLPDIPESISAGLKTEYFVLQPDGSLSLICSRPSSEKFSG